MNIYNAKATCADGSFRTYKLEAVASNDKLTLTLPAAQVESDVVSLDFAPEFTVVMEGDEGYFVIPQSRNDEDHMLCRFVGHEDGTVYESENPTIPVFGVRHPLRSFLAVVTGMPYSYHMVAGVVGGIYYLYPRFILNGQKAYEDISVTYHLLSFEDADYCSMARLYRGMLLESGSYSPIPARENATLRYAKESLYVRIRMGWKPAPSPVADQTRETEPPVHVACDFERVGKLMDAYHARGIDKAEFCLVGWNVSGHDGRWPEAFPVEEKMGGETALRALIEKAKSLGYQITCHTNSNSAFHIAEGFNDSWLRKDVNGETKHSGFRWSGGLEYELCPKIAWEFAEKTLPRVAELGFSGLHYVDVIGLLPLKECHDPVHPVNFARAREFNRKIASLSRELFGGFSSEGVRAHIAKDIDFGLYISYNPFDDPSAKPAIADEFIPLWQLIYHGIVLSNPYTATVNAPIKSRAHTLKLYERGGRPTLYYYSKFVTEQNDNGIPNWMGATDFIMDTDEELEKSADRAAELYHEYSNFKYLQNYYMEEFEKISPTQTRVTYSDGSVMTLDYENGTVSVDKKD